MPELPHTLVNMEEDKEESLNAVPGSGGACSRLIGGLAPCCVDRHHRKLAICSIICGISCVGIQALINSVKAETAQDPETAASYSRRARKLGIISVVTWVSLLASFPLMLAMISYLLTLQD